MGTISINRSFFVSQNKGMLHISIHEWCSLVIVSLITTE